MILCEYPYYDSCDPIADGADVNTSRYEMYAEDGVAHQRDDVDGAVPVESGPAIEVIELANGETVWYVLRRVSLG